METVKNSLYNIHGIERHKGVGGCGVLESAFAALLDKNINKNMCHDA